jgi:uncharacterized membrane protein YgcG
VALPDSYAGVIAALKEQSGSTKFYKPNFQGIIEAIQDMGGGGSINVLPPGTIDPPDTGEENDGDMIAVPNGEGNYFLYVYADGQWQKIHVTTEEVETIGTAPFVDIGGEHFDNQSEINWYIWNHLEEIEAKGYDDTLLWKDQDRQDKELADLEIQFQTDQDRQDQEFAKGQAEQDEALAEFKQQVAEDQARQDDAIAELQAGCQPGTYTVVDDHYPPNEGEVQFSSGQLINLGSDFIGAYSEGDAFVIEGIRCTIWTCPGENEYNGVKFFQIKASVPSEITDLPDGSEVTIDLCDTSDYVSKNEFNNDQKRQDDANKALDALLEVEILALNDKFEKGQAAQDDAFAKGQAAQDDAFAKGQATQDKALQDEIDARAERDLQHDAQISTIEYKLDALLGLQFRGVYRFKHDTDCDAALLECYQNANGDVNAQLQCNKDQVACEQGKVTSGVFEAVDPDDQFEHLLSVVVHETDLSGVETEWANVLDEGDYLEIDHQIGGVADKTNYGLYRITEEPEVAQNAAGENVYSFQLQFLQGDGEMLENEIYEIRGINKDEGVNPEELADFLTKEEAIHTYLPLIGGTLTGTLKMKDANVIQTRHLDSGQNSDLQIKREGQRRILVGSDKVIFDVPPECGAPVKGDNQLVNKKYVDANKATGAKGEKGELGEGEQGQKGARGSTGSSGSKGNRGSSGSKGARGNDMVMQTGTNSNPSLSRGKMYWNYSTYTLYIGK